LVLIPFVLIFFWSEKGFVISNDPFLNLALHMSSIDISFNITSPSKERTHDNVTYMLCMLIGTLSGGCFKSMIKWSNVCLWNLKFVKQKAKASGSWYIFMLNVMEVFDYSIWWWYWKVLDIDTIGMTFFGRPSKVMSCKVSCFLMNSFKST
jgi:hypothetical protein